MKNKLLVMGLAAVFAITGMASAQNLLNNGDFNTPIGAEWTIWQADASGWVSQEILSLPKTNGALHVLDAGVYDGTLQMTLGAAGAGPRGMYQVIGATAGEDYTFSLDAGAENWWLPNGSAYLKFLDAADSELASFEIDTTASIHGPDLYDIGVVYQNFSVTETAPAGTTQIKVEIAEWAGTGSAFFDNLEVVPEPGTLGLVGIFGAGLWFVRKRR